MTLNKNIAKRGRGPGKRTLNFLRMLKDQKCDPEVFLARVVNNDWQALGFKQDQNPVTLDHRIAAAKALMPYKWPQLKSVEVDHINPSDRLTIIISPPLPMPVANGDGAKVINEHGIINGRRAPGTMPNGAGSIPNPNPQPFPPPKRYASGGDEG